MPSASQLREACGFYTDASVGEAGIRYAGAVYSNEYTRNQRKARLVDRIAKPGEKVEIKVDPFDLGAITVLAKGEMISVSARDPQMHGKTLRQWQTEKLIRKQRTEAEKSFPERRQGRSLQSLGKDGFVNRAERGCGSVWLFSG